MFNKTHYSPKYKTPSTVTQEPVLRCQEAVAVVHWHGQHKARWSWATGIKRRVLLLEDSCQLIPTTPWHFTAAPLSILEDELMMYCTVCAARLGGDPEQHSNNSLSQCPSIALFTHNSVLRCVVMREGQSVASCTTEAEFSLTVLYHDAHSAVPVPCTHSHRSALTPGYYLTGLQFQTASSPAGLQTSSWPREEKPGSCHAERI